MTLQHPVALKIAIANLEAQIAQHTSRIEELFDSRALLIERRDHYESALKQIKEDE